MKETSRRNFLRTTAGALLGSVAAVAFGLIPGRVKRALAGTTVQPEMDLTGYNPREHLYSYIIDLHKCIGCGSCVQACRRENKVPTGFYRTWVERYQKGPESDHAHIDSPNGGLYGFPAATAGVSGVSKAYFVPKMCNHCSEAPCVQVCPFGASFKSPDGVMLVDKERCMACGYCVQACPYAARWINPVTHVADKCTWCYQRITKGLKPACVQACPTGTRRFGDIRDPYDPVTKVLAEERVGMLQPQLLTKPKCYYLGLDKEVR
ncbi:MAG: 4Fe-4S dicluster domain-containing protein [bacterium]|nr:4Fe-4S dicluster domain-containing protein [bacterium]